jgi:hypothetical protein
MARSGPQVPPSTVTGPEWHWRPGNLEDNHSVNFDRTDPGTNSLTDFDDASRNNAEFPRFLLIGIFGIVGFILYSKQRSIRH